MISLNTASFVVGMEKWKFVSSAVVYAFFLKPQGKKSQTRITLGDVVYQSVNLLAHHLGHKLVKFTGYRILLTTTNEHHMLQQVR